jgi:hypothetical protein
MHTGVYICINELSALNTRTQAHTVCRYTQNRHTHKHKIHLHTFSLLCVHTYIHTGTHTHGSLLPDKSVQTFVGTCRHIYIHTCFIRLHTHTHMHVEGSLPQSQKYKLSQELVPMSSFLAQEICTLHHIHIDQSTRTHTQHTHSRCRTQNKNTAASWTSVQV